MVRAAPPGCEGPRPRARARLCSRGNLYDLSSPAPGWLVDEKSKQSNELDLRTLHVVSCYFFLPLCLASYRFRSSSSIFWAFGL